MIIFSDVEAKNFQLAPSFFDRKKFGTEVLVFPDRVRLTVDAIKNGKSAMFLGGWLSFTGEMGKGGWDRTGLKEVLPVRCSDYEDLVESTRGIYSHPHSEDREEIGRYQFLHLPSDPWLQQDKGEEGIRHASHCQPNGRSTSCVREDRTGKGARLYVRPGSSLGMQFGILGAIQRVLAGVFEVSALNGSLSFCRLREQT